MKEVFLIGKVISKVEFDFMIESRYISIGRFYLETMDKKIIEIKAYDNIADFVYKKLIIGNIVFLYGRLNLDFVSAKIIKILK